MILLVNGGEISYSDVERSLQAGRPVQPTLRCGRLGPLAPARPAPLGPSLMLAPDIRLKVVSEIPGHATITITKDVYGHLVEGDKRELCRDGRRLWDDVGSQNGSRGGPR